MTTKEFHKMISDPQDAVDKHLKYLWDRHEYHRIFSITGLWFGTKSEKK